MIRMSLSEAARVLDAKHLGRDAEFAGVSTDSRALQRDNLFVALHGPHFDGHAFLTQAMQQGAAAALVDRPAPAMDGLVSREAGRRERLETALPGLRVQDTRIGLGQLAAAWRARHTMPLVAVTGSNGKTTVKEMIAAILAQRGPLLVTQGNLNNDIGVPLTILRLESAHRHAVIEMGANHPGEISTLTRIARPTVALITNAGPAHLEGFGSIEGVARAKGEIYQGLSESGIAVVNADDAYAPLWRELAGAHRMMTFGLKNPSDVGAEWQAEAGGNSLQLITPVGAIEVKLPLPGRHNVMNALAAAAAALAAGAALADIKNGLEAMRPVHGRLQRTPGIKSAELIDDTYNANPASLQAALDVLAACATRKWLVLGDMGELGGDAAVLHEQAGETARAAGVEALYATGELSRHAVHTFGAGAEHFSDHVQLIAALTKKLEHENDGVTILIKGSRSARMEDVVAALCRPAGATV